MTNIWISIALCCGSVLLLQHINGAQADDRHHSHKPGSGTHATRKPWSTVKPKALHSSGNWSGMPGGPGGPGGWHGTGTPPSRPTGTWSRGTFPAGWTGPTPPTNANGTWGRPPGPWGPGGPGPHGNGTMGHPPGPWGPGGPGPHGGPPNATTAASG